MALRGLLRPKRPLDFGKNAATPQDARRALTQALKRQKERLALSEAEAVDVQLLGQVTSADRVAEAARLLGAAQSFRGGDLAASP